ncbi:Valine--tRNA ligase [Capsicum baccatum]|uniref:valine--tRNA ligase n=1 Tax=Capsicum baccatum TaxID=33114 RepID=A0A2G2XCT9_CAPBA|nr:Valine--tRNA ligase [Capsicum baccatum]
MVFGESGANALRFTLVLYTAQSDKRVAGYRQWCNKLWNAFRFSMCTLGDDYTPPTKIISCEVLFRFQWIESALKNAVVRNVSSLESYDSLGATSENLIFKKLCSGNLVEFLS